MKIIVDKLPSQKTHCPYVAFDVTEDGSRYTFVCGCFRDKAKCDLGEQKGECRALKEYGSNVKLFAEKESFVNGANDILYCTLEG